MSDVPEDTADTGTSYWIRFKYAHRGFPPDTGPDGTPGSPTPTVPTSTTFSSVVANSLDITADVSDASDATFETVTDDGLVPNEVLIVGYGPGTVSVTVRLRGSGVQVDYYNEPTTGAPVYVGTLGALTGSFADYTFTITPGAAQNIYLSGAGNFDIAKVGTGGGYTPPIVVGNVVTFEDHFLGSSVDTSKWNIRNNTANSNEQSYLKAANVTVSGGLLNIAAKREVAGGKNYTSGYIDSIGKFSQRYGIWQVRAKLNTPVGASQGMWPAPLWLRGDTSPMEIDLVEGWGTAPGPGKSYYKGHEGSASASIHQNTNGGQGKVSGWLASGAYDFSQDFHVFECQWLPNIIKILVDGVTWVTATPSNAPWAFTGSDYLGRANMRVNLQVSKDDALYGGPVASTVMPSIMQIDYIRVLAVN